MQKRVVFLAGLGIACAAATAADHGGVAEVGKRGAGRKAGLGGAQVADVVAVAQAGFQAAAVRPAVGVAQRDHIGAVFLVVGCQAIPILVGRHGSGATVEPAKTPVWPVVVVQVIQAQRKLVGCANSQSIVQRQPTPACCGTFVVTPAVAVSGHCVDAQGRIAFKLKVEVTLQAHVVFGADRCVGLLLGHQTRLFADLVDDAACGATAKQHGRRTAQHFHAVIIEGVAVVLGDVAHAVTVNVARSAETAQPDVVAHAAAFTGFEGDADDVFQRAFEGVLALVMDQLVIDHGQGLRNVFGGCRHLSDAGQAALVALRVAVPVAGDSLCV